MSGSLFGETRVPVTSTSSKRNGADGDWITAHCDGGSRGNPGPAGYGAVLVDSTGQKLIELGEFLGVCTNNVAEYRGLLATLEWAFSHGYRHLRVISDSLLMVQQINGRYKVNSPDLRPLWEKARTLIRQFDGFEISHALRHKNKDADRLANEAMDRGTGRAPQAEKRTEPTRPAAQSRPSAGPAATQAAPRMLRGFVRDGAIHLLGGAHLPDGVFVKVIPE